MSPYRPTLLLSTDDAGIGRGADIVRAGARHLLLNPMFDDLEHLELLAQEVLPHL